MSFFLYAVMQLLRGLALVGDGVHLGGDGFLVAEEVILDELAVVVELEDVRDGGREVQGDDVLVGDALEVFDDTAVSYTL